MKTEDVLAFASRDWGAIAAMKDRSWQDLRQRKGPEAVLAIADLMRRHFHSLHPEWPTEADRRADIETHARVHDALSLLARQVR